MIIIFRWIPVQEKLPMQSGKYLVTVQNGNVYAGTFDAYQGKFGCKAIAWAPLPPAYEPKMERHNIELHIGCRGCSSHLYCPDAFTDVAPLCNGYKEADR